MQEAWKALLRTVLAGTERAPLPDNARLLIPPASDNDTDRALEQLTALHLLRKAAAPLKAGVCGTAPAAVEVLPACPNAATQALAKILAGVFQPALPEFIRLLEQAGYHWPHAFLPELLDLCSRDLAIYRIARPVLGRRAGWLAGQNPAWQVLAPLATADWPTAGFRERLLLILDLREKNPDIARDLVQASWQEEPAENRRQFLETFREGLSDEDIPFLETAALDRSRAVRLLAFQLLVLLPESPTCRELRSVVHSLPDFPPAGAHPIDLQQPFLKRLDGLDTNNDRTQPADRLLRLAPPSAWENSRTLTPATLAEIRAKKHTLAPFLPALLESATLHRSLPWQTALAEWLGRHPDDSLWEAAETPEFLEQLPAPLWNRTMEQLADHALHQEDTPLVQALLRSRHPWEKSLFRHIMTRLGIRYAEALYLPEPHPRKLVLHAAYTCAPVDILQWLTDALPYLQPDRPWRRLLEQMHGIARFRKELYDHLPGRANIVP